MKKTFYYLLFIVITGIALTSFWSYKKYFKKDSSDLLTFSVERGNIQDVVRVRGQVVSQKDFNLEFPFAGIINNVLVSNNLRVEEGDLLMGLDTTDFQLEIKQAQSQLSEARANLTIQESKLTELEKGTRIEEIQVQEAKVSSAKIVSDYAEIKLINKIQDSYTKSDDAIRNRVDQFFYNPRGSDPKIKLTVSDSQLKLKIERQRIIMENILVSWKSSLEQLTTLSDLDVYIIEADENLYQIKSFLNDVSFIINDSISSSNFSQSTIDGWKSDIVIARTNINVVIDNITTSEENLKTAKSNLLLSEKELLLKEAGTVDEKILAQKAQVEQAKANIQNYQNKIAIIQEKINKSFLYSPVPARVVKVWFEKQEFFRPGNTAVTLETFGQKIQADISELEIRKINKNNVLVQLDAFPGIEFNGKVISIEPREVIKDGDKYYRTNIYIDSKSVVVRSGMNADLTILVSSKDNVLKIPEFAVYRKDNKEFVTILKKGIQEKIEIKTGISDGDSIEVVKGLSEGQVIVVSAD